MEDLAKQQVELREGLILTLYSDDLDDKGQLDELLTDGIISFSEEEHCWVAAIDWAAIHHASDKRDSHSNGDNHSPTENIDQPAESAGETGRLHD
jgi:hypothetical protein